MFRNSKKVTRITALITAFIMVFTAAVFSFAEGSYAAADKSSKSKKPRVLIVDTYNIDSRRAKAALKSAGFKVTRVYSLKRVKPSKYDALVIPGGGDVDPGLYNEAWNPNTYRVSRSKDKLQIKAIKKFAKAGKPVLGICRGCQVINVAYGGKLNQHLGWHIGYRKSRNVKGYWMRKMYGKTSTHYHIHHQCVSKLGKGLVATSYDSSSGLIESIQHKSKPIYGVQWHPELNGGKNGKKFFKQFKKIVIENRDQLIAEKKAKEEAKKAAAEEKKAEAQSDDAENQ